VLRRVVKSLAPIDPRATQFRMDEGIPP